MTNGVRFLLHRGCTRNGLVFASNTPLSGEYYADCIAADNSPKSYDLSTGLRFHGTHGTLLCNTLIPAGAKDGQPMDIWFTRLPFAADRPALKWDGESHVTYEVFRDLGQAFLAVLVLIYILVAGWFRSFRTPFIIMAAIPFSLVGILPAHWMLGAFFTATLMIGFIAGVGIVVRNSIILVDFIQLRLQQGMVLADAVIDAGAVRFRPMMLTAAAVIVGASVILFDPIFQGLAISLMAGEVASLLLSRMAVPIIYHLTMSTDPVGMRSI
ncbi:membrane hypothetical protein [Gammaproteobacteria bacterium]